MNCKETLFEYITSIEVYPFSGTSSIQSMAVHRKYISESDTGVDPLYKTDVPLKAKSGSLSEKTNVEHSGESYEVTVSWQIQALDNSTYTILEELHERAKHLILRTYDNKGYFVRAEEEGYQFSYSEKDGVVECELIIHNKSGAQRVL